MLVGRSGSFSRRVTASFPCILAHSRFCLCPPIVSSRFHPVLCKSCNQISLDFKVRFLEDSQSVCHNPGWEAWCEVQNLHNYGRTSLVLLFSRLCVAHPLGMQFDFIMFVPLLPSCCSFFFVFGLWISFFGGFQHPAVNNCSTSSCSLLLLQEGMSNSSIFTFFKEIPKYMRVVLFIIGDWNAKSRKSRDTWSNK